MAPILLTICKGKTKFDSPIHVGLMSGADEQAAVELKELLEQNGYTVKMKRQASAEEI